MGLKNAPKVMKELLDKFEEKMTYPDTMHVMILKSENKHRNVGLYSIMVVSDDYKFVSLDAATDDTVGALSKVGYLPTGKSVFIKTPEIYKTWEKFTQREVGMTADINMTVFSADEQFLKIMQFMLTAMCQSGDNNFKIPPVFEDMLNRNRKVRIEKPLFMHCNDNVKAYCLQEIADAPKWEMLNGYIIEPFTNKKRIDKLSKLFSLNLEDPEYPVCIGKAFILIGEKKITRIIPSIGYDSTHLMDSHKRYELIAKRLKRMQQAAKDTGFDSYVSKTGREDIDPVLVVEVDVDLFYNGSSDIKLFYERMDELERNIESSI